VTGQTAQGPLQPFDWPLGGTSGELCATRQEDILISDRRRIVSGAGQQGRKPEPGCETGIRDFPMAGLPASHGPGANKKASEVLSISQPDKDQCRGCVATARRSLATLAESTPSQSRDAACDFGAGSARCGGLAARNGDIFYAEAASNAVCGCIILILFNGRKFSFFCCFPRA